MRGMLICTIALVACTGGGPGGGNDSDGATDDTDTDGPGEAPASFGDATFDIAWDADGVTLMITDGSGDYELGMAETGQSGGGWYGEDCIEGQGGYFYCHTLPSSGGELTTVNEPWEVENGGSTLLADTQASGLTYAVWNDDEDCITWGDDPIYYTAEDCTEIAP